jgi:hypothetical protein
MKKQPWEVRMDAADKRHDARLEKIDARLDRIAAIQERSDKRIDSILKLLQMGAKQLVRMEEAQARFFEGVIRPNGKKK